jgi:hypothetical protein
MSHADAVRLMMLSHLFHAIEISGMSDGRVERIGGPNGPDVPTVIVNRML